MNLTITERSVTHNTFVIERSYPVTPQRVFAAFADPAKKRHWFVDGEGHQVEAFQMDFRVGGTEHVAFRYQNGGPFDGTTFINNAVYLDLVTNQRLVVASSMSLGDKRISSSLTTFELLATDKGTTLIFTHQGAFFPGSDGPQIREAGWRHLLERLAGELA